MDFKKSLNYKKEVQPHVFYSWFSLNFLTFELSYRVKIRILFQQVDLMNPIFATFWLVLIVGIFVCKS